MIDEKILKFLHDNCLDLVSINFGYHQIGLSVFLKKQGGGLVLGHAKKTGYGAEEDLSNAFKDALSQVKLLDDFEALK